MQRPSSRSYRPGYYSLLHFGLLESINALDEVSRVPTQPPTQQHVQKCDPQILKPFLTFCSD